MLQSCSSLQINAGYLSILHTERTAAVLEDSTGETSFSREIIELSDNNVRCHIISVLHMYFAPHVGSDG